MCVGPTKGTYRRDIKMIVNHDYALFLQKKIWADYTSKYCLLSIQLTSACPPKPTQALFDYTSTHQFRLFCVCMLLVPLLKPPLRNFAITHLILGLHYCALVTFSIKLFYTVLQKNNLIRGQGLAVKGGIKI